MLTGIQFPTGRKGMNFRLFYITETKMVIKN